MRALTQNSQFTNSQLLRNPLISRFSKIFFRPAQAPARPPECCSSSNLQSTIRNPQFLRNRIRATKNPKSSSPSCARESKMENRKWNNPKRSTRVSPCFTICPISGTLHSFLRNFFHPNHSALRISHSDLDCFVLYRFVSLSIPLSECSINSAPPTTSLCPKDLHLPAHASNQHTATHCHTLNFPPGRAPSLLRGSPTPRFTKSTPRTRSALRNSLVSP